MKLHYYKEKNFGDSLNTWLWEQLIPGLLDEDDRVAFLGIGTLINDSLPVVTKKARCRVIFGTGVGYGKGIPQIDDSYKIYCVRGPLSAQALDLPKKFAVTDGAILVRKIFNSNTPKKYKFSYMPHYELAGEGWNLVCEKLGFGYIDPRWSIESILSYISQTEVLLTEAMHGAIVADALRIPWIPIVTNPTILQFKWLDWCQSIDVEYTPVYLERLHNPRHKRDILTPVRFARDWVRQKKAASQLLNIAKTKRPTLSSNLKIENLTLEMYERLEELKNNFENGYFDESIYLSTKK